MTRNLAGVALGFVSLVLTALGAGTVQPTVTVDWTKPRGVVQPVNGIGRGPLVGWIGTDGVQK